VEKTKTKPIEVKTRAPHREPLDERGRKSHWMRQQQSLREKDADAEVVSGDTGDDDKVQERERYHLVVDVVSPPYLDIWARQYDAVAEPAESAYRWALHSPRKL
jgi:hypothetical protein